MNKRIKYLVGFLLIIGALVYLLLTTFQSSLQYYVTVSELYQNRSAYDHKVLKVAGKAFNIEQDKELDKLIYKFIVKENNQQIDVVYGGMVPDTFKEEADVVVTGSFDDQGIFRATEILAKCASKYEAQLLTGP